VAASNPAGGDSNKTQIDSKKDADNQITDTKILRSLTKQLLLNDSVEFRFRTLLALGLLVGAKV
jgi:ATP-binding cassette, subfamily B (MDR/TAP), member 7